jgi:hypothetical protein
LLGLIDDLPTVGPGWECDFINVIGDELDENGNPIIEEVEFWRRDPVQCIQDLIGNPIFRDVMKYAPERIYRDKDGRIRLYGEAWSADWWWQIQVRAIFCFGIHYEADKFNIEKAAKTRYSCTDYSLDRQNQAHQLQRRQKRLARLPHDCKYCKGDSPKAQCSRDYPYWLYSRA